MALYHNQHGYYSSSIGRKIGRSGDFYTSVSVGDTFGNLLSYAIEQHWPKDLPLCLVEQGAHDGQLATDIVSGLRERQSPLLSGLKYYLVEPSQSKRQDLDKKLDQTLFGGALNSVCSLKDIDEEGGIFLCNELLDAFPVRRFSRQNNQWCELFVVAAENEPDLAEKWLPIETRDPGFERFLELAESYYKDWPEGYETEFCESLDSWIAEASGIFSDRGFFWIIDYGFAADRYFEPNRHQGTLKCYSQHRAHQAPIWRPGECDISAHVNYTHLNSAAEAVGLKAKVIEDQSQFLTRAAKDWLLAMEGAPPSAKQAAQIRQFQTLTHPSMMGRNFQVVQLMKGF